MARAVRTGNMVVKKVLDEAGRAAGRGDWDKAVVKLRTAVQALGDEAPAELRQSLAVARANRSAERAMRAFAAASPALPDLAARHVKPVSDVWGIAATFYNMLTGALVRDFGFGRDPINVILSQPPVPIRKRDPSIPRRLATVIDRALSEDVAERYQTAEAFRDAPAGVL